MTASLVVMLVVLVVVVALGLFVAQAAFASVARSAEMGQGVHRRIAEEVGTKSPLPPQIEMPFAPHNQSRTTTTHGIVARAK